MHLTHVTQKPYSGFGQIFRINTPIIYPPGDQKDPDIQESVSCMFSLLMYARSGYGRKATEA